KANYETALQAVQYTNTSDTPSTLQRTLTWKVNDGSIDSNTQTTTINVVATNDAPVLTVTGSPTFTENGAAVNPAATANIVDVDDANMESATIQITGNFQSGADVLAFVNTVNISGSFVGDTLTLTGSDTKAAYIAALQSITYTNTSENPSTSPRTLTWTVNDGTDPSNAQTTTITVNATNDAPVLSVTGAVTHNEGGGATNVATAATITDVDDTNIESATIQITGNFASGQDVLSFVNTVNISGSFVSDTLTLTGSDTKANYQAALLSVQYTNTSDTPSTLQRTLTWKVNDGSTDSNTQTTTINVVATNDAPVLTVTGSPTFTENGVAVNPAATANIVDVDDANMESATIQITGNYAGAQDVLSFVNTVNISGSFVGDTLTLTGSDTKAAYIAALQSITYTNTSENPSTALRTLTWTVNDGTDPSNTQTTTITVNAVNDAPVNTVPAGTPTMNQDTTFTFNGGNQISVADLDLGAGNIQITLTGTNGTVTLSGTTGLSFVFSDGNGTGAGDGTADATMTFRGSLTNVNNALNGLQFTSTPGFFSGPNATLQIVSNDLGNTGTPGAQTDSDTVQIFVQQVNQNPINTVPGAQVVNEDATLTFSSGNSNQVSIADPDAGVATVQVQLTVTTGTLTLNGVAGLSFVFSDGNGTGAGDGTADATMTFRGTIANINTALNGMTFTGGTNVNGSSTFTIVTNDLGNTGPGGPKTDTDNVAITITAVNDAPVITRPATATVAEDAVFTFNGGNVVSIADVDAAAGSVTVSLGVANGTLSLSGITGLSFTVGDGTSDAAMTFSGTLAAINAALTTASYAGNLNLNGPFQITMA
ncbi:MAG TPA: hypothetical protein VMU84_03610, partial [Thermoanaerobaculia bacterium]|nr:hypothetical protein [Thermoanaerobaculia bacterium]